MTKEERIKFKSYFKFLVKMSDFKIWDNDLIYTYDSDGKVTSMPIDKEEIISLKFEYVLSNILIYLEKNNIKELSYKNERLYISYENKIYRFNIDYRYNRRSRSVFSFNEIYPDTKIIDFNEILNFYKEENINLQRNKILESVIELINEDLEEEQINTSFDGLKEKVKQKELKSTQK